MRDSHADIELDDVSSGHRRLQNGFFFDCSTFVILVDSDTNMDAGLHIRRSDLFPHWTETSRIKFSARANTETADPLAIDVDDETNVLPIEKVFVKPDNSYDFLPEDNNILLNNDRDGARSGNGKDNIKSELHFNVVLSKNACQGLDAAKKTAVYLVHKTDEYVVLKKEVSQYVIVVPEDVKGFFVGEKLSDYNDNITPK